MVSAGYALMERLFNIYNIIVCYDIYEKIESQFIVRLLSKQIQEKASNPWHLGDSSEISIVKGATIDEANRHKLFNWMTDEMA